MRKLIVSAFIIVLICVSEICALGGVKMLDKIKWLGHASFKITGEKIIYIDPWKLQKNSEKADIILITHPHFDHLSKEDVNIIKKDGTVIVTAAECAKELAGIVKELKVIKPGESIKVENIGIKGVHAYNINKKFHEKSKGWLGFIIEINGEKLYHSGDTDNIPEMEKIEADIALLPIGGTYTMTPKEAAEAAEKMKTKVVIPMHYGDVVGSSADAEKFKKLCKVKVEILPKE